MGAIPEPMEFDDAPRIPLREPDAPVDLAAPAATTAARVLRRVISGPRS